MASYTLHIQYVDRPAETRTFTQAKVTFGRDSGDVVLHDTQVSGKHGEITFDGSTLRYTDVGSTNGSFLLQGQRVANIELTPGIALRLGNSLVTVQVIDAPNVAGKGRTVIAGPGMAPGFPARPPGGPGFTPPGAGFTPPGAGFNPPQGAPAGFAPPAPGAAVPRPGVPAPAPAPPGGFAYAQTAQMQGPMMPAGMPGGPPAPMHAPPAPMAAPQPGFVPQPAPMTARAPSPMAPPTPAPMHPASAPVLPMPPAPGTLPGGVLPQPPGPPGPPSAPAAHPPGTAQVYDAGPALPQPVDGAANPAPGDGDLVAQIKHALLRGLEVFMPVAAGATMVVAAVYVSVGVLVQLFAMILPTGVASLLALVLLLAQVAVMVLLMPGLYRHILGSYLGQPVELIPTVQAQIPRAADVAVNCFVPMIVLGVFAGPVYWVENKKLGDVIKRNFSLLGLYLGPILLSLLAAIVAVAIIAGIPAWILGKLPLGGLLASIWSNLVISLLVVYFASFSVAMYFDLRRRHEGGDPEGEARAQLSAALPPAA